MSRPFRWQLFGPEPYETVYALQKHLVADRLADRIPDTLLLGEHPHIITLGRGTRPENILNPPNIPIVEIERGGDVTYHGPGQLVGYPIFNLEEGERDLHQYLRKLEAVIISVLDQYDICGERKPGWTGVWVGESKIASIGVAVKKWVTYHGFALNVTTDLACFDPINPCGLSATVMTSMQALLPGVSLSMEQVQEQVIAAISQAFDRRFLSD